MKIQRNKKAFTTMLLSLIMLLVAACSSSSPSGSGTTQTSSPAPSASASAAPAEAWKGEADWKKTVEAANKEGKLIVSAPSSEQWRNSIMAFEKDYPQIKVEYTSGNSRDFWPKVEKERQLGQFLWDLRIGGTDPQVYAAKKSGVLDPVRPLLVLPEVVDNKNWIGGLDGVFADDDKKFLPGFLAYAGQMAYANRDFIPKDQFFKIDQLTDPKWKGKIVLQDPRGGAGLGYLAVFLKAYGEQFVTDLLSKQDIVITGDTRQLTEWVVRGKYPIGIGLRNYDLLIFANQGVKFNVDPISEGPLSLSLGSGGIQYLNKAPHPNASKVFMNWIMTKKVQEVLAKETETNSRRTDVTPGDKDTVVEPKNIKNYFAHQEEYMVKDREKAQELATKFVK